MAVLTLNSKDFDELPVILKTYASNLATIKGNSEMTVCEYLMDLRTFFRYQKMIDKGERLSPAELEKISIKDLSIDDIKRVRKNFIHEFLIYTGFDRKNSTTTRMRKLSSLRSFFRYLYVDEHLIDSNPMADIDSPKKRKTLPKYLTLDEAVRLLESVKADTESKTRVRDYAMIALFLNTGMRLSELVGLNVQSFDPELTRVTVVGKGNKERVIYLNDAASDAVLNYLRIRLDPKHIATNEKALFISAREQRISKKTVQYIVYKYLKRAGLGSKGLSVHKLRHTAATLMYQSGKVDIRVLQDILGHEQLNTTQIYTHVVSSNLEDAMQNNPLSDLKFKTKLPKDKSHNF